LEKKDYFNPIQGPDLTWKQIIAMQMNQQMDIFPDSLRKIVADALGPENTRQLGALEELGLFSDTVAERQNTPIDTLVPHLAKTLAYKPGERDLVVLNHDVEAQLTGGNKARKVWSYCGSRGGGHSRVKKSKKNFSIFGSEVTP
jgi:hypothetical protein